MELPNDSEQNAIKKHVAGATVVHTSPFASLDVPIDSEPLPNDLIQRFVIPFYLRSATRDRDFVEQALYGIREEMSDELIARLLANKNWRPRKVGALFTAIGRRTAFETQIGRLLLRSDVCFAGRTYCTALAVFNSSRSREFLVTYLNYYLTRHDLFFDQLQVMAALCYLDSINGTDDQQSLRNLWSSFAEAQQTSSLERATLSIAADVEAIHDYHQALFA